MVNNIRSSKSIAIWEHGGRFDGEEVPSNSSSGGGVVRLGGGVKKEKSPDFRSPEVGISVDSTNC